VYDEAVMEGLDFAIAEAGKRGIKLILALEGFWLGLEKYIEWSQDAESAPLCIHLINKSKH
jgi:hypothetical protein